MEQAPPLKGYVKAADLARTLGLPRRTVSDWCRSRPGFAKKVGHDYYISIRALAKREGLDEVKVRTLLNGRLIKAVQLAELGNVPRRTVSRWCKERPNLALRIGRLWYLAVDSLGCDDEQSSLLKNNRLADVLALLKREDL